MAAPILALKAFEIVNLHLQGATGDIDDVEDFIAEAVDSCVQALGSGMSEWTSNYTRVPDRSTTSCDTFRFKERRVVLAYSIQHLHPKYINIVIAVMKDRPKPNLSIRKVLYVYDSDKRMLFKIEDELPKV